MPPEKGRWTSTCVGPVQKAQLQAGHTVEDLKEFLVATCRKPPLAKAASSKGVKTQTSANMSLFLYVSITKKAPKTLQRSVPTSDN